MTRRLLLIVALVGVAACHPKSDVAKPVAADAEALAMTKAVNDTDAAQRDAAAPLPEVQLPKTGMEPGK